MNKPQLNKWEKLFIEFLDMTEFYLCRRIDEDGIECYGLEDGQKANLGDIESDFFYSASNILERMETYKYDYIIRDLEECARWDNINLQYATWQDLLKYRNNMPDNQGNFEFIDMICNHPKDIDIDKVYNYLSAA